MAVSILTPVGVWLWDKYGKLVADRTVGTIRGQWDKFRWRDAAEKYRGKIKKLYGTILIIGMAEPIVLDDIFTDVYILDRPTALGRFDIERLRKIASDPNEPPPHSKRINGLRLVREKRNLFILGKPGAGKTTFLRYIALQAAEQNIDKIPIFISLKEWADSNTELMTFISDRFSICNFPAAQPFVEELLSSGSAIVLFDGVDEVSQESGQRDKQIQAIDHFVEKYERAQCLLTCRIAATDYSFQHFSYVEIADFTENQINRFVGKWFRTKGEQDTETVGRFLDEFSRERNKGLRDLARTPLLLTLLCLAFDETLTFPRRLVEIYKEALDALLKKWDSSRRIKRDEVYRKLSLGHKENLLSRIAAQTFESNQYFIPQRELEQQIEDYVRHVPPHDVDEPIDAEAILKAIEHHHGLLVERAREIYSFSHLAFQEYFTAKYVVSNAHSGTLLKLINAHHADDRWREVFLLTTSLLPDATDFLRLLKRSIDGLLDGQERLQRLLMWADNKVTLFDSDRSLSRLRYLFIELYYVKEYTQLANTLYYGRLRDPRLNIASARDPFLSLDLFLTRDLILADDIRFERDYSWDHAEALAFDLQRRLAEAHELAVVLGLDKLAKELAELHVPMDKPLDEATATLLRYPLRTAVTANEWQACLAELRSIISRHRDIGYDWKLSEEEEQRLIDYINTSWLFEDCLQLAFMRNDERLALLSNLYCPPSKAVR